ncbi:MAG: glycosyltransferase [Chitinophagaceae bacterium]
MNNFFDTETQEYDLALQKTEKVDYLSIHMQTKKILLLWSPLADYTVACFRQLALRKDIELTLVYQPEESLAPYGEFDLSFCHETIQCTKENKNKILQFCISLRPDTIIMTSWNYSLYMKIARQCRQQGTYVISAFDGQWKGTLKQRLGILISPFFLRPSIDNFFVTGDRQATFSRKLGYKNPLQGYYSANTARFTNTIDITSHKNNFIFTGRLISIKGIASLINAYKKYRAETKDPWGLIICGKGNLQSLCDNQEGVNVNGFLPPAQLARRFQDAKCLILPSTFEPWGLVIHEAALAGLLVISSHSCGASTFFVRDGQNGYIINPDENSLLTAMKAVSQTNDKDLQNMSEFSKTLASLWTTDKWADYVYKNINPAFEK